MPRGRSLFLAVGIVALAPVAEALSADYPPDPPHPVATAECYQLATSYNALRAALQTQFNNLGNGHGPQVQAGACCAQTAASKAWCSIFQSHAAVWEQMACVDLAKGVAVGKCLASVRINRGDDATGLPRYFASEEVFERADQVVKLNDWLELARSWASIGNEPAALRGAVERSAPEVVQAGIRDPIIQDFVNQNLEAIGVANDRIDEVFDQTIEAIETNFPGAVSPGLRSLYSALSGSSAGAGDPEACKRAATAKIGACIEVEFAKPGRDPMDFTHIDRCSEQFRPELNLCGG